MSLLKAIKFFNHKNFIHVYYNHYKVKNYNGFKNALYDFFGGTGYTKKEIREMVKSFPTSYPCDIYIEDLTFQCCRIFIYSNNSEIKFKQY